MKTRMMLAGVMLVAGATAAEAQCPTAAADACRKATDLLSFMTPQLSTALAGGNPTLGQGGVLGGLGHFSLDIRASAVESCGVMKLSRSVAFRQASAAAVGHCASAAVAPATSITPASIIRVFIRYTPPLR